MWILKDKIIEMEQLSAIIVASSILGTHIYLPKWPHAALTEHHIEWNNTNKDGTKKNPTQWNLLHSILWFL